MSLHTTHRTLVLPTWLDEAGEMKVIGIQQFHFPQKAVFHGANPLQNPTDTPILNPTIRPPINNIPTAPIFSQNQSYSGSFTIPQQASEIFDTKNTNTYFSIFNLIQNALDQIFVTSSLRPYAAQAILTDLQNRGNDLTVLFRVNMFGGGNVDQNTIAGIIRSNLNQLQNQIGENARIDPNTIFVFRMFL
ncbi:hypothetical protein CAEBREN_21338 [Caenorhabditis brenneri]|uniref:SEA domain-containing protein n=1 Tax=Caenorhabditis brenneri TaxID=135651 RepID=G0MSJ1_CAEBE|nr:hypothetical protein CAEBREN_21338 [Caenorhabditis brenneri]